MREFFVSKTDGYQRKNGSEGRGGADITKYVTESRISTRATGFLLVHVSRDPLDAR